MKYFFYIVANITLVVLFIAYMINKFFVTLISVAGSLYFSLVSVIILAFIVITKKSYKNISFLFLAICIFLFSFGFISYKEILLIYLEGRFVITSKLLYLISGLIFFYCINFLYNFILTDKDDIALVWSVTIIITPIYFLASPVLYYIL